MGVYWEYKDEDERNVGWIRLDKFEGERPSWSEEFLFGLKRQRVKWEHEKSVDSF